MAISFRKYVDITSGVGGNGGVRLRDLIGRLFTTNNLVPTGQIVEMTTLEDVGNYFGFSSEEYLRASFYFGWVSKNIKRAKKISFAKWAKTALAPRIYGAKGDQSLAAWTVITNGSFYLTLGSNTQLLSAMDFSGAASLSAVAGIIQTKLGTVVGDTNFSGATVTWDATRKSFNFIGGTTGNAVVTVAAGTSGTDIAAQLGWLSGTDTILSDGSAIKTITECLTETTDVSNNFGSFLFLPALSDAEVLEAATWNDAQNNMFMFCVPVLDVDTADYYTMLAGLSGVGVTLKTVSSEYPEMIPMTILAATDYNARSSVQNYMFQVFGITPAVTTTTKSNSLDNLRVNYYGRTQTAGQYLDFYQRGVLMGLQTDATDMNVYANEIWLKDAAGASLMSLLLSVARLPANTNGRSRAMAVLQSVADKALFNGTISVGKPLNEIQKLYITEMTGDELAWYQVQTIGYWLDAVLESYVTQDSRTEWKLVYTLIYSKDDAIRKVDGTHVLI